MTLITRLSNQPTEEEQFRIMMSNLDGDGSSVAPYGDLARSNSSVQNGTNRLGIRMEFLADGDPEDYDLEDRIRENDVPVEPLNDGRTVLETNEF